MLLHSNISNLYPDIWRRLSRNDKHNLSAACRESRRRAFHITERLSYSDCLSYQVRASDFSFLRHFRFLRSLSFDFCGDDLDVCHARMADFVSVVGVMTNHDGRGSIVQNLEIMAHVADLQHISRAFPHLKKLVILNDGFPCRLVSSGALSSCRALTELFVSVLVAGEDVYEYTEEDEEAKSAISTLAQLERLSLEAGEVTPSMFTSLTHLARLCIHHIASCRIQDIVCIFALPRIAVLQIDHVSYPDRAADATAVAAALDSLGSMPCLRKLEFGRDFTVDVAALAALGRITALEYLSVGIFEPSQQRGLLPALRALMQGYRTPSQLLAALRPLAPLTELRLLSGYEIEDTDYDAGTRVSFSSWDSAHDDEEQTALAEVARVLACAPKLVLKEVVTSDFSLKTSLSLLPLLTRFPGVHGLKT